MNTSMNADLFQRPRGSARAYGVVLWRDSRTGRGLIWCEDHQDLAVFDADLAGETGAELAANDRVLFEEDRDGRLRRVCRILERWSVPTGAGSLGEALLRARRPERILRVV